MSTMPYKGETLHSVTITEVHKVAPGPDVCDHCVLNTDSKTCIGVDCQGIIWVTAADFALVRMGMEPSTYPSQEIEV